jgi:LuxR family transcriptional regulator, maltose regulon positive regulatory protein
MATAAWLAATKLTPPARRHDALQRSRLVQALERSLAHLPLTLISAPAGSGKTTLLSELTQSFPQHRFCWLLLDAEDNDPSRFTAALISSLIRAGALDDEPAPNEPRALITFLINRIAEHVDCVSVLVLDDLHLIHERAVHEILDYLLDHAPANLRVILATRHDPPMSLARRRARGEVGEIRLEDLSFTEQETSELATTCLRLSLSADEVRQLHARTEGWAAGLRLLATSLSQAPGSREAVLQGSMQGSRRIFDFLAEEVLDRQPEDLRRFLLETSILARLNPEVCDALTGRNDSRRILEDLYRRNLYVVAADESESAFRYHDLFADFLRERLRRDRPGEWNELQVRAARAETSPQDRLRHLLAGKAWDEAAAEIERVGPEYAARGFVATLRRWIDQLPESVRERHPRVLYLFGQAIWTLSEFSQAHPFIEKALEGFRTTGDHEGQAQAIIALANSALMANELDKCRDLLKEALSFDIPASSRVQLHTASAWEAIYRQDWPEAMLHLDGVFTLVESGEGRTNPLALMLVLFSEGIPGQFDRIDRISRAIRDQLKDPPDFAHACYYLLHSAVLIHRGDVEGGEHEAHMAEAIGRDGQISIIVAALCTSFAISAASRGDWEEMNRRSLGGLDETQHGQIARNWRLHSLYFRARAMWHSGNMEGLREVYDRAMAPNPVEAPASVGYRSLIRGIMRMAERSYAQAEQAFRDAVREEEGFKVTRAVASARTFLGFALLTRGRPDEAMEVFLPYLRECEEQNVPGCLLYHNPIVQPLLRHAHERGVQRPFVEKILDALGSPLNVMESTGGEALSDREMEVLRVMAEGLGNREIGERLFVSEATVKTHVQRILRKLDAASRTQAVTRARELMLI